MKLLFALVAALALSGCMRTVDVTDPGDAPPSDNDAADAVTTSSGACDPNAGTPVNYTSQGELESMLLGRWRQCSGGHLLGGPGQGIEILADHTFYMLVNDSSGNLVRATGISSRGTWGVSDCSTGTVSGFVCQLNVMINGGGDGGHPSFTNSPRQMLLPTSALAASPPFFAAVP